jgi:tRNA pseudouridine55 synthase
MIPFAVKPSRKALHSRIDGVLLLDKPAGMTSNAALQKAKWLLDAAKAGHTGTLDPIATGLLPICFGEATKFAGQLLDADKRYVATVRLGIRTETADAEGRVIRTRPVAVTLDEVEAVLSRFRGRIEQTPPMHSALKRDGRPLYEYARKGIELERAPRTVTIFALTLRAFDADRLEFEVDCSKGTYIRTLAQDIGEALGCGGHLIALRRTRIGRLHVEDAVALPALEAMPPQSRSGLLQATDVLLAHLPRLALEAGAAARFMHGQTVRAAEAAAASRWRVYAADGRFLGLGQAAGEGRIAPLRLLANVVGGG